MKKDMQLARRIRGERFKEDPPERKKGPDNF